MSGQSLRPAFPSASRSHLLWHRHCRSALVRSSPARSFPSMPAPDPQEATEYVLLHRDTGLALYSTLATERRSTGPTATSGRPATAPATWRLGT
jgi:hypothetical protein